MLEFSHQPHQQKLLNMVYAIGPTVPTRIGFGGSRGGSKSRAGRDIALRVALENPRIAVFVVTRNLDKAVENYVEKYRIERPQIMQFYRASSPPEFHFPEEMGGSRIAFRYGDHPDDITELERGPEAFLVIVEQAEQFSERELIQLKSPNRWPGALPGQCKILYLFNPRGQGSTYLQRVFYLKHYEGEEKPWDYAFIQTYGWQNFEWFRNQGITVFGQPLMYKLFYTLPEDVPPPGDNGYDDAWLRTLPDHNRFKIFVTQTSEGRKHWGNPESIRMGDLFGRFDMFAGQYLAGIWDERRHVIPERMVDAIVQPWWSCWMSTDWGIGEDHWCVTYWFATGKMKPSDAKKLLDIFTDNALDIIVVYRELIVYRTEESDFAHEVVEITPELERRALARWVAGSDTKTIQRGMRHSTREIIDEICAGHHFPRIQSAHDEPGSRSINAGMMRAMLHRTSRMRFAAEPLPLDEQGEKQPLMLISAECPELIAALPALLADPKKPGDFQKIAQKADDCADAFKYGCAEYASVKTQAPREVRLKETMDAAGEATHWDPAAKGQNEYMAYLKFMEAEKQSQRRGRRR